MTTTEDFDREQVQPVVSKPLTFGSLFAGIGGIDLGFERAGLHCKWQVEIDAYAQKVLAKHWPEVIRHDDVRTWPQPDTEYVDIIAGGFPCQDISYAGKGAGLAGERSGLFYEVMRIVSVMGPRIVVLENVAALLTRGLSDVLGSLASLGYDAEWHCIPASSVGAPHKRDRVFIIANTQGVGRRERRTWGTACTGSRQEDSPALGNANSTRLAKRKGERSDTRQELSPPERASWWITEPDVGRVANGIPARVDRLRGLGNAVVPQVAEWIGRRIVAASKDLN